jgi:hypothetical protein
MEKMEKLMNETEVSEFLGVSLACVRRWRLFGEGPEYKKVGPLVRYRPEAMNGSTINRLEGTVTVSSQDEGRTGDAMRWLTCDGPRAR